jgi:hypothetical protein
MTFEMLRMEISLGAMRAREFSIGILDRNDGALGRAGARSRGGRPAGVTGKNTPASLRAHDMSRRLLRREVHVGEGDIGIGRVITRRVRFEVKRFIELRINRLGIRLMQVGGRVGSVPRRGRVAPVERLHDRGGRLQRR